MASEFIVSATEAGRPLIDFLAGHLGCSKGKAKALLDARVVLVNDRRVWMAKHALHRQDHVEVAAPAQPPRAPTGPAVLYEDADYLVINKPVGLLATGPQSVELLWREKLRLPELTAVHRLDRETTGCLLLAKQPAAREAMIPLFQGHEVSKLYHAVVWGRVPPTLQAINAPLEGQLAQTRVQVLSAQPLASHVRLMLVTGRTHQIRKHMALVHHPVLGDKTYLTAPVSAPALKTVHRQMLHAFALSFRHPQTSQWIRCTAPLPADFTACLRALKLK